MIYENIFNEHTLNIFTDASVKAIKINGVRETLGCPGFVTVKTEEGYPTVMSQNEFLVRNSTNNESEIMAIEAGIMIAISYSDYFDTINLFSDSKICIYGLRKWIFDWVNCKNDDGILHGTSGPVANQNIFKKIVTKIIQSKLKINLFHQKGHVNIYNPDSVYNALQVFNVSNHCNTNDLELISRLSVFNDLVDKNTKAFLNTYLKQNKLEKYVSKPMPISYLYNLDMPKYSNLINRK